MANNKKNKNLALKKPKKREIEARSDRLEELDKALKKHFGPSLWKRLNEEITGWDLGDIKYLNPKNTTKEYRVARKVLEVNMRVQMKLSAVRLFWENLDSFGFDREVKSRVCGVVSPLVQQMETTPAYVYIWEAYLGNEIPVEPESFMMQLEAMLAEGVNDIPSQAPEGGVE